MEPTSGKPAKLDTEKIYEGILYAFEKLQKRFRKFEEANGEDNSQSTLDYLSKLASSLGYMAQTHASLAKSYQYEKRLSDLEKKFNRLPPEVLHQIMRKD